MTSIPPHITTSPPDTLVFATYILYIIAITAPPTLLPSIRDTNNITSGQTAKLVALKTLAQAISKLIWGGWPIELCRQGPTRVYALSMSLLAIILFLLASANSVTFIAIALIGSDLVATPIYPAHVKIVSNWWPKQQHGQGLWLIGLASRTGVVFARIVCGLLLTWLSSWRTVIVLNAIICLVGFLLAVCCHKDHPQNLSPTQANLSWSELGSILRRMTCSGDFWLAVAAYSLVTIIKRLNEQLISVYIADAATSLVDEGFASELGAVWTSGLVVSVLVGGKVFNASSKQRKLVVVLMMCLCTIGGCCGLAIWFNEVSTYTQLCLMLSLIFVTASGLGVVYYIIPFLFCIKFGKDYAAVLSGVMDGLGLLVSAMFLSTTNNLIDGSWGWSGVWWLLGLIGVMSLFVNLVFSRRLLWKSDDDEVEFVVLDDEEDMMLELSDMEDMMLELSDMEEDELAESED